MQKEFEPMDDYLWTVWGTLGGAIYSLRELHEYLSEIQGMLWLLMKDNAHRAPVPENKQFRHQLDKILNLSTRRRKNILCEARKIIDNLPIAIESLNKGGTK